jgi:hypothetical protein
MANPLSDIGNIYHATPIATPFAGRVRTPCQRHKAGNTRPHLAGIIDPDEGRAHGPAGRGLGRGAADYRGSDDRRKAGEEGPNQLF